MLQGRRSAYFICWTTMEMHHRTIYSSRFSCMDHIMENSRRKNGFDYFYKLGGSRFKYGVFVDGDFGRSRHWRECLSNEDKWYYRLGSVLIKHWTPHPRERIHLWRIVLDRFSHWKSKILQIDSLVKTWDCKQSKYVFSWQN